MDDEMEKIFKLLHLNPSSNEMIARTVFSIINLKRAEGEFELIRLTVNTIKTIYITYSWVGTGLISSIYHHKVRPTYRTQYIMLAI